MNKTLKALLLGYIKFRVNDRAFYTYNTAQKYCNELKKQDVYIKFDGFNPFLWVRDLFRKPYYVDIEECGFFVKCPRGRREFFKKRVKPKIMINGIQVSFASDHMI